ncbi:hypothetical protein JS528_11165 [Bifidobacterium sp. MA2]|uniref:Tail assembly chaperone n=1 Tax=Bifidobacterium santillanense TaxID=2809028 RepID=A0ABS5USG6_9BIFI|nr:hypothetical protein [Bifidobacterium santillanense]MBT1173879.1 hypothetical protein [Bifidobacterium santillanense]
MTDIDLEKLAKDLGDGPIFTAKGIIVDKDAARKFFGPLGHVTEDEDDEDKNPVDGEPEDFTAHLRALALMAHENLAHIETDALAHKWADIHGIAVNGKNIITRLVHAIDELED